MGKKNDVLGPPVDHVAIMRRLGLPLGKNRPRDDMVLTRCVFEDCLMGAYVKGLKDGRGG